MHLIACVDSECEQKNEANEAEQAKVARVVAPVCVLGRIPAGIPTGLDTGVNNDEPSIDWEEHVGEGKL